MAGAAKQAGFATSHGRTGEDGAVVRSQRALPEGGRFFHRVAAGIRATRLPLAKFPADDLPPFDPAHPDALESLAIPASPQSTEVTPPGN